jgi:hypothetical protein
MSTAAPRIAVHPRGHAPASTPEHGRIRHCRDCWWDLAHAGWSCGGHAGGCTDTELQWLACSDRTRLAQPSDEYGRTPASPQG